MSRTKFSKQTPTSSQKTVNITSNTPFFTAPFNELPPLKSMSEAINGLSARTTFATDKFEAMALDFAKTPLNPEERLKLALEEAQNSNLIDNINDTTQDQILAHALLQIDHTASFNYSVDRLSELQLMLINQTQPSFKCGIRRKHKNLTSYIKQGALNVYTPPEGRTLIKSLLQDWNSFHTDYERNCPDKSMLLALSHYQFESIHPFYEMNGRIGRLLLVELFMKSFNTSNIPIFSKSFNLNKHSYHQTFNKTRLSNDIKPLYDFYNPTMTDSINESFKTIKRTQFRCSPGD